MPALGLKINSYQVKLGPKMVYGTQNTSFLAYAHIRCFCEQNHAFDIFFLLPNSPVPAAYYLPPAGSASGNAAIFLPQDQYKSYIDLLRHEKPVSAYIWTERPDTCHIYTGNEPVGEGEI